MEVYNGPHLIIKHEQEHSRLINIWKSNPVNDVVYRQELLGHLKVVEERKPSQVMWLLENLTFKVDDVTKLWVDKKKSTPIFRSGFIAKRQDDFDQVAFVVGYDVLAYIEVMDICKESSLSGFKPMYFATEIEARNWLSEESKIKDSKREVQELEITYKGTDDLGKSVFEFKEPSSNFVGTINSFKTIIDQNHFFKNNVEKYSSLTPREKETLKLLVKGYTNEQIAGAMNVSHHTIRTHRNRIWRKLEIKHVLDCLKYQCFFN
jgi:DNA-binding CsgD family transcriptional regulator